MDTVFERYGVWLLMKAGFKKRGYSKLMKLLHELPFKWYVEKDKNRAADGMRYRDIYWRDVIVEHNESQKEELFSPQCSLLEMLVGLSNRIEDEYIGDPSKPHEGAFFWELCCNIGFNKYRNTSFNEEAVREIYVNYLVKNDVKCDFFPLKQQFADPMGTEIWLKVMRYLYENY